MRKNILFTFSTIVLVLIAVCSISVTVKSMYKNNGEDQHFYDILESEYIDEVTDALEQFNLYNSGITMTRISSEDGNRTYIIRIHNSKISKMDIVKQEELSDVIESIQFHEVEVDIRQELIQDIN